MPLPSIELKFSLLTILANVDRTNPSVTTVDGIISADCDEAEQMLTEMHDVLENKFGVRMGEVLWQGKNPNRTLRKAEKLPSEKRSRSWNI